MLHVKVISGGKVMDTDTCTSNENNNYPEDYTYYLPDENNEPMAHKTTKNAVIIVGANGSGKSRLGAWMEKQDNEDRVHRIGGQRRLNFNDHINIKSYKEATNYVMYGHSTLKDKIFKWSDDSGYITKLVEDFEDVLAALIALQNKEANDFFNSCKIAEKLNKIYPQTPETTVDKLIRVWDNIFPQRKLCLDDAHFYAELENGTSKKRYLATEMSDGERAVLYLASQVLTLPKGKTIIIDEPELHLHGSIMNKLWMSLEKERVDCLFIYITHDMNFTALHGEVDKIWIKSYDGVYWQYEKLLNTDIPEDLCLSILGSRKPVLFVEGTKQSYDTQIYSILYSQYNVIACGSCTEVISLTKAFNKEKSLHAFAVYGIIDRDFRTDREIEIYKKSNIFTIDVAEVENLFLVEEIIKYIACHQTKNPENVFHEVEKEIRKQFFEQVNKQICMSFIAEIKYILNTIDISNTNIDAVQDRVDYFIKKLPYDNIKGFHEKKFKPDKNLDYKTIIKIFNYKNMVKCIGHYFGLKNDEYCPLVINLLKRNSKLKEYFFKYMPQEILVK